MGVFSAKSLGSVVSNAGVGGLLGGWTGAGIGALSGLSSAMDAASQYSYQKSLNNAQMSFQERMSNTAHQREVEDLKKAGINPLFSAVGSGATTPSGAVGEAPSVNSSRSLEALARKQANESIENERARTAIQRDAQRSQARLNLQQELAQQSLAAMYSAQSAGYLYDNMIKAQRFKWMQDHPNLVEAQYIGEALSPWVNSALGLGRLGTSAYGARKAGIVADSISEANRVRSLESADRVSLRHMLYDY